MHPEPSGLTNCASVRRERGAGGAPQQSGSGCRCAGKQQSSCLWMGRDPWEAAGASAVDSGPRGGRRPDGHAGTPSRTGGFCSPARQRPARRWSSPPAQRVRGGSSPGDRHSERHGDINTSCDSAFRTLPSQVPGSLTAAPRM